MSVRRGNRSAWLFAGCVLAGAVVLAWLSSWMLALERREATARRDLDRELEIRDILWQMDAWLAPILAQEVQRPADDYLPFNGLKESYSNRLARLEPGQVLVPSPLLTFRSDLFPLHFNLASDGTLTSPQVPGGNARDVVQSQIQPPLGDSRQRQLLTRLQGQLDPPELMGLCSMIDAEAEATQRQTPPQQSKVRSVQTLAPRESSAVGNFQQRARSTTAARKNTAWLSNPSTSIGAALAVPATVSTGSLTPTWFEDQEGPLLLFVRATQTGERSSVQGFVADWSRLHDELLGEVAGAPLSANAKLVRCEHDDIAHVARRLTTVPARLVAPTQNHRPRSWTPVCGLLTFAWAAFAAVAVAVGFTLRQAISFGDRRARFASAVAHELRTPLTTFRMYSELLASDMVTDPAKRKDYFDTLQSESDRLGRLVENVLGYARIEDGRFATRCEDTDSASLLERHHVTLDRRAQESARELQIRGGDPSHAVHTDPEAVGQILFNLVDNACKYGSGAIEITAIDTPSGLEIAVRDSGKGIAHGDRARVFAAFDRGTAHERDGTLPGIGLGLALSRGLAQDLGGDLRVEDASPGARFVLTLPGAGG